MSPLGRHDRAIAHRFICSRRWRTPHNPTRRSDPKRDRPPSPFGVASTRVTTSSLFIRISQTRRIFGCTGRKALT